VNESAGEQTSDLLNDSVPPQVPDSLDAADYSDEDPSLKPRREGLPPGFRMRHDKHYVEELMSNPSDRAGAYDLRERVPRTAAPRESAPDQRPSSPVQAPVSQGAALDVIASRMESAVGHAAIARAQQTAPALLAQAVHTEFARIARLARAAAVLHVADLPLRRAVPAGDIAAAVRAACVPVARLGGLDCDVTVDDAAFTIVADRSMAIQSIAGTVDALIDLLLADPRLRRSIDDGAAPRLAVSMQTVKIRPALIVDVICPALAVRGGLAERFFDNRDEDFRETPAAGILLASAGHVAQLHGGRADVKPHSVAGATVTFVFPQEGTVPGF
jgi:hypothetical protein